MRKIDPISYAFWQTYIKPHVKRSLAKTRAMRLLLKAGPLPGNKNPVIKRIIKDGRGMDGFQAAMMTWNYLTAICRHHELKLQEQ